MPQSEDLLLGRGSRFTPELVELYASTKAWRNATLNEYVEEAADRWPRAIAAMTIDPATGLATGEITYADLRAMTRRVANGLSQLGVGAGDVVAVMTPNRLEFSVLVFAVASLGAVYTGIPVTYGAREAVFEVERSGTKVLVMPSRFRDRSLLPLAREVRAGATRDLHVVLFGDAVPSEPGWSRFSDLVTSAPREPSPVAPFSLAQLGFTSGTTNEPKAVMNTHQTLDAMIRNWKDHLGDHTFQQGFVNLVMSPVGHSTGYFWGALLTALVGGTAVYLEHWNPDGAARAIERYDVSFMVGSPTFLLDLLRTDSARGGRMTSLHTVVVAGAPVPRSLIPRAREALGCFVCPAWGMTENGIGISAAPDLPSARTDITDGVAVAGTQVRVVDQRDVEVPSGTEGELQISGSGMFAGYYGRPDFTEEAFVDGWFRTGDRAKIDADGFITLTGRTKDIIIRGGENLPVAVVESLLYRHPAIKDAAVIALPDERLGERACAVVKLVDNQSLVFDEMRSFLLGEGISKRFLPERLETVDEMPKTPSGKIRKVELRERFGERESQSSG